MIARIAADGEQSLVSLAAFQKVLFSSVYEGIHFGVADMVQTTFTNVYGLTESYVFPIQSDAYQMLVTHLQLRKQSREKGLTTHGENDTMCTWN